MAIQASGNDWTKYSTDSLRDLYWDYIALSNETSEGDDPPESNYWLNEANTVRRELEVRGETPQYPAFYVSPAVDGY